MIARLIHLPESQSFFLLGPRQTGKSTLIDNSFKDRIWKIDLLMTDQFLKYTKYPEQLRLEALEKIEKREDACEMWKRYADMADGLEDRDNVAAHMRASGCR